MAGSWNWKSHSFVPSTTSNAYSAASEDDVETTNTRPPEMAGADSGENVDRVRAAHSVDASPLESREAARRCCSPPTPKNARVSSRVGAVAVPALTPAVYFHR